MSGTKKPRKKSEKQLIIESLLNLSSGKINWPLEMKMVTKILEKIPDVEFWHYFGKTNKYATLIHLLSDINTTNIVSLAHFNYTKEKKLELKKPEQVKLEEEKIGEDIIVPNKPKTLLDFIK